MSVSLSSILNIATSGLEVAQTGLNTVSNNISNVNTAGYVREIVNQQATAVGGQGLGVSVADIARTTNTYLEAANQKAAADSGSAAISSSYLDQAQSLFGDPTSTSSFFGQLDSVFSAFSTLASSPSTTAQAAAVGQVSQFLNASQSISASLRQLSGQADAHIATDVSTANGLLSQISKLNSSISQATVSGQDATGAQNQQSALVNQLSGLMNVTVSQTSTGGVTVKASDGTVLAGDQGAATLSYDGSGAAGEISLTPVGGGATQALGARLTSGELAGLVDLRNNQLPSITGQLANLTSQTAATLNAVSNSYSSVPAPSTLTGRNTGMDLPTDISNFTGKTTVGVVNSSGVLQTSVAIDFSAGSMTAASGATASFTPSTFLATLNNQLGGAATASFANGALSISAGGGAGVVIADDAATPSSKAGQGFSQFFGLNDLVSSATPSDYDTGLTTASASGFPAGQSITFDLTGADGSTLKTATVQTPAGATMGDLVNALNNPTSGVGLYGAFQLDANGALSFTATGGSGVSLSVKSDTTANTATGTSLTTLFGLDGSARTQAAGGLSVRSDIASNSALLQSSSVNLAAAAGTSVLAPGDTSAADAFSTAGQTRVAFAAAGGQAATTTTLSGYASTLSGSIATRSSDAATAATNASSVATETASRLSSAEGVNVDQEMISLTTYQQAYSASARLISATQSMFTALMNISTS